MWQRYLRGDAVVNPETGEDLDVWKVNLLQQGSKPPLCEEKAAGDVFSVFTVLGWDEEFNASSFGSPREGLLHINHSTTNCAEYDVDALENVGNTSLVGVVNLGELGTLGEPFRVAGFDSVLPEERSRSRQ